MSKASSIQRVCTARNTLFISRRRLVVDMEPHCHLQSDVQRNLISPEAAGESKTRFALQLLFRGFCHITFTNPTSTLQYWHLGTQRNGASDFLLHTRQKVVQHHKKYQRHAHTKQLLRALHTYHTHNQGDDVLHTHGGELAKGLAQSGHSHMWSW